MKIYYDTDAAIAFISKKIVNNKYSPFINEGYISFLTLEEALHALFAKNNFESWYPGMDKINVYKAFIKDLLSTYKVIKTIDGYKIISRIIRLVNLMEETYKDYIKRIKPKNSPYPGFMDLTHLAIAENICDVFVTGDHQFKKLSKIKDELKIKIVIIDLTNFTEKLVIE